jgi:hypothetical protein
MNQSNTANPSGFVVGVTQCDEKLGTGVWIVGGILERDGRRWLRLRHVPTNARTVAITAGPAKRRASKTPLSDAEATTAQTVVKAPKDEKAVEATKQPQGSERRSRNNMTITIGKDLSRAIREASETYGQCCTSGTSPGRVLREVA